MRATSPTPKGPQPKRTIVETKFHAEVFKYNTNLPNTKYPKTKPKKIKVKEIGKPMKIANNITAIKIKPNVSGLINSAIMRQATFLFWLHSNF